MTEDAKQPKSEPKADAGKTTAHGYRVTVDVIFPVTGEKGRAAEAEAQAFAFKEAMESGPPEGAKLVSAGVEWASARVAG
jgi:hypothetical protein